MSAETTRLLERIAVALDELDVGVGSTAIRLRTQDAIETACRKLGVRVPVSRNWMQDPSTLRALLRDLEALL